MINCNEAKKISLVSILDKIGAKKVKQTNREVWYLSPFRNESTSSFKIDLTKNIWFDHGEGIGGNVLDFMMRYYECDLKRALQILNSQSFSFQQQAFKNIASEKEKNYEIRVIKPLTTPQLINYIQGRHIDSKIAQKYCREVHYTLNGKEYYGVGFKNVLEGYEVRNKYVKMCLGKKALTLISNNKDSVVVLESWSDFVSFLTLYPHREYRHDFLILNSVAIIKQASKLLIKYARILACLDNDEAGNTATKKFIDAFPNNVKDGRSLYSNHKDLNDFIIEKFGR